MSKCKNSGCTTYVYSSKYHFCPPCYKAWQEGGQEAVQARLQQAEPTPQVVLAALVPSGHSVVNDVALQALRDELDGTKRTVEKMGDGGLYKGIPVAKEVMRDITTLQAEVRHLRAEAQASRTCVDFALKVMGVTAPCFNPQANAPTPDQILELIQKRCRGVRAKGATPHPSATAKPTLHRAQLDRIEGKLSEALRPSYLWPCFWAAAAGALTTLSVIQYGS